MLHKIQIKQSIKSFFTGLLAAAVILCFCGSSFDGGEGAEREVTLYAEAAGGEGKEWEIRITPPMTVLGEGSVFALLLTVEAPQGLVITDISPGEGAEGMVLTASYGDGGRVAHVLLDGAPTVTGDEILRIRVEGEGEVDLILRSPHGKVAYLYCMREDGEIMTYPVTFQSGEGSTAGELGTNEPDTDAATHETTVESEPATEPPDYPIFVGCRETVPDNGYYAVQFLFDGEEGETPVFCLSGQGNLTADTGKEGEWSYCTLRGLAVGIRYVFGIMTEDGLVYTLYENGKFAGYTKDK
jgi:hypothetical protein